MGEIKIVAVGQIKISQESSQMPIPHSSGGAIRNQFAGLTLALGKLEVLDVGNHLPLPSFCELAAHSNKEEIN